MTAGKETHHMRFAETLTIKEKLLTSSAMVAIGTLAIAGCSSDTEPAPISSPIEQTPTETPVTPLGTAPTDPETATQSPEVSTSYEVDVESSTLYNGLSKADREIVDRALGMTIEDFEALETNERNLAAYVLFDAGYDHYREVMKDVQVDKWGIASDNDGYDLLSIYDDAVMKTNPWTDLVPEDWEQRLHDGTYNDSDSLRYIGDGYMSAEKLPRTTEQLFWAVASDMAVAGEAKYHPNLKYAQMMMSGLYEELGDDEVIARSRMDQLETIFTDSYDAGTANNNWPDNNHDIFSREVVVRGDRSDGRVELVLVSEDRIADSTGYEKQPGVDQLGDVVMYANYNSDRVTTYIDESGKEVVVSRLVITSKEDGTIMPPGVRSYE